LKVSVSIPEAKVEEKEDQHFDPNHIHIVVKKKEKKVEEFVTPRAAP
jgi:hypothetical protein